MLKVSINGAAPIDVDKIEVSIATAEHEQTQVAVESERLTVGVAEDGESAGELALSHALLAGLIAGGLDGGVLRRLVAESAARGEYPSREERLNAPIEPGDVVHWRDPDGGASSGFYTVSGVNARPEVARYADDVVFVRNVHGCEAEVLASELRMI